MPRGESLPPTTRSAYNPPLSFTNTNDNMPVAGGPTVVDPDADEVGVHELCPHGAEDLVLAVLHQAQLARVEDQAHVVVLKVEL